jgi:hypothetical protein
MIQVSLENCQPFRFDHLFVDIANVFLDQSFHRFEVFLARQSCVDFLNDKDTVLVFHHTLHHILSLQDFKKFFD